MRTKDVVKAMAGGAAVYVAMAACSAGGGGRSAHQGSGGVAGLLAQQDAAPDSGGSNGSAGLGSVIDAMADALTDPVADAAAQSVSGSRLKARYWVGEDGSKQFAGWYDSQREEACSFQDYGDGVPRCRPSSGAFASYFLDSGCTVPLFNVYDTECSTAPKYGTALSGCTTQLYQLAANTPSMVYVGKPGACTGTMPPAGYTYYSGTLVSASVFVAATEQVE